MTTKKNSPPRGSGKVIPFPEQVQEQTGWTTERRQWVRRMTEDTISFIDDEGMFGIAVAVEANLKAYRLRKMLRKLEAEIEPAN